MDMADLRARFRGRCDEDVEKLKSVRVTAVEPLEDAHKELLVTISHRISGSGGIFGYGQLSQTAHALESLLIEDGSSPADIETIFNRLLDELEETAGEAEVFSPGI
jgi:HPt (histidine-containing phosphotransfer) domain-containing protein